MRKLSRSPFWISTTPKSDSNSQPRLRSHTYRLPKTSFAPESEVVQPHRAGSTSDWILRQVLTLSIAMDRSRRTSSNRRICYATLSSSSSRTTLQLCK